MFEKKLLFSEFETITCWWDIHQKSESVWINHNIQEKSRWSEWRFDDKKKRTWESRNTQNRRWKLSLM